MAASAVTSSFVGQQLSVSQRVAVKNSLTRLKASENFPSVEFWGRINGTTRDYLIACAVSLDTSIEKVFYVSDDDGISFAKLSRVSDWSAERIPLITGRFSGDLAKVYADPTEPPKNDEEEEDPDEEDEESKKMSKPKITEKQRLSWTVNQIDTVTTLVPRGAFTLKPTGEIVANKDWNGLTADEARSLSSYLLFRNEHSEVTDAQVRKQGAANIADFMDPASDDMPKGVWSLQTDDTGLEITLRNLLYPGYEFHLSGFKTFSGAYFGTGEKNEDILFML